MTTRLFLHSPSEAPDAPRIAEQMPEFERYGERALLLAGCGDVVCLARAVDERYLSFLDSLEIGPRGEDIVVVEGVQPGTGLSTRLIRDPHAMARVAGRLAGSAEPLVVCPFFPTGDAFALGHALEVRLSRPVRVEGGSPELVRRLHDKVAARALAESLGISVAPGQVVRIDRTGNGARPDTSALEAAIERWSGPTGHAIVRGASGASGSSIFTSRIGGFQAMIEAVAERTDNSVYLVEPLFEASFSPNIEVLVEPEVPSPGLVGASEQVLDGNLVYNGSAHPSHARRLPQMIADSLSIVAWMQRRSFTGRVGFDFVEHVGSGGAEHFLTEINPRINGASYPLAVVRRLAALASRRGACAPQAFRTGYERVRTRDFGELVELTGPLLYDPDRGEGVVPYSVGALPFGKVGIACFGPTPDAVEDSRQRFVQLAGAIPGSAAFGDAA